MYSFSVDCVCSPDISEHVYLRNFIIQQIQVFFIIDSVFGMGALIVIVLFPLPARTLQCLQVTRKERITKLDHYTLTAEEAPLCLPF